MSTRPVSPSRYAPQSSPANELAVNEVPLKDIHVEDVQVERVSLHTVQLAVCTHLGLPLVEVGLSARLAVQLLDIVGRNVEQVAVIRLLIRRCETAEDQDVLVRNLVEAAPFEADPIGVLLDPQV